MKYKVAKPEDFTDIEEYQFKLARAYSIVYSDLLIVLVKIDAIADTLEEYNKDPIALEYLRKITDGFK